MLNWKGALSGLGISLKARLPALTLLTCLPYHGQETTVQFILTLSSLWREIGAFR